METEKQIGWEHFIRLCQDAKDEVIFKDLLDFLFTFEEKEHLAKRILLVRELLSGEKPQREISKDLKISVAKITRGSNALKQIDPDLKEFLSQQLLNKSI